MRPRPCRYREAEIKAEARKSEAKAEAE